MLPQNLQRSLQLWDDSAEPSGIQDACAPGSSTHAVLPSSSQPSSTWTSLDPIVSALQSLGLLRMETRQLEQLLMEQEQEQQQQQRQQQWQQPDQAFVNGVPGAGAPLDAAWQSLAEAMAQQPPAADNLSSVDYSFAQQQAQQQQQALWALSSGMSTPGLNGMIPPLSSLLQSDMHNSMQAAPSGSKLAQQQQQLQFSQPLQESHTVLYGDALAQRLFGGVGGGIPAPQMSLSNPPRPYRQHATTPYGAMRNGGRGRSVPKAPQQQQQQQQQVSAAPNMAPRAPMWAKPSWDPMAAVMSSGQKASSGTGVFIPKTSMPAASAASSAGAPAPLEAAMGLSHLHDAAMDRGLGFAGSMGMSHAVPGHGLRI